MVHPESSTKKFTHSKYLWQLKINGIGDSALFRRICGSCFSELEVRSIDVKLSASESHRFLLKANTTMLKLARLSRLRMSSTHIFLSRPAFGPEGLPRPPVTFCVPPRPPIRPPRPAVPLLPPRPAICLDPGAAVPGVGLLCCRAVSSCTSDAILKPVGRNASCSPTL